jgi:hypothetical protein
MVLIGICLTIRGLVLNLKPQWPQEDTPFLTTVDSVFVPAERRDSHIARMTTVITSYMSNDATLNAGREASRYQLRSFFIILLAALISAPYLKESLKPARKKLLLIAASGLTAVMYGLDVHTVDLMERQLVFQPAMNNTLRLVSRLQPEDNSWHYLDFSRIKTTLKSLSADSTRREREFLSAISPSLEQCGFYILPILCIGGVLLFGRDTARSEKHRMPPGGDSKEELSDTRIRHSP